MGRWDVNIGRWMTDFILQITNNEFHNLHARSAPFVSFQGSQSKKELGNSSQYTCNKPGSSFSLESRSRQLSQLWNTSREARRTDVDASSWRNGSSSIETKNLKSTLLSDISDGRFSKFELVSAG